ncbi:hypothetical protein Sjap_026063 [Stephania japonica]|uniref:Uncharacterized protein n=1 Tax=Stephania japonica TaxID=461633 RepID=A0AAP0E7A3_9MAGN
MKITQRFTKSPQIFHKFDPNQCKSSKPTSITPNSTKSVINLLKNLNLSTTHFNGNSTKMRVYYLRSTF